MANNEEEQHPILQFAPMQSFVDPSFWHKLSDIKLDEDRASDPPRRITGSYTHKNAKSCLLEVDYSAFVKNQKPQEFYHKAHGTLYNKNTIEEFKAHDKVELMRLEGIKLLQDFQNGKILEDPSLLARFFVVTFADLKNHNFFYWFGFPCPLTPPVYSTMKPKIFNNLKIADLLVANIILTPPAKHNFFALKFGKNIERWELKRALKPENFEDEKYKSFCFCFANPSEYEYPSWIMRVYVAFVFNQCPNLIGKRIKFCGICITESVDPGKSIIWEVLQNEPNDFSDLSKVKFVGWEANKKNKMGPRMVCMRETMDPSILAENSINLNLKLMKWRLVPDLDLEKIAKTKCLLFGAGTLGCAVARNLLAWGFKHIHIVDSGKIGYSNPVRQSLYTIQDAMENTKMKATTAAERIREINPTTDSKGYVLQIPMPGHTVGAAFHEQVVEEANLISQIVQTHDVIFLLTDSRESRWLPTVLGAHHKKIVINAALGFDSYLVMRHGSTRESTDTEAAENIIAGLKCIPGNELGCYFCNDITAPGNSLKDRTLDQQCTVTRPGVSNIGASFAVELLVAMLQDPQCENAPAYYAQTCDKDAKVPEGLLGIIPHSVRGNLCNYENILPATQKFTQCVACSEKVLNEYREKGTEFLFKVFESAKYLEELTGIADFRDLSNEMIDFHDSDLDISDDEPKSMS